MHSVLAPVIFVAFVSKGCADLFSFSLASPLLSVIDIGEIHDVYFSESRDESSFFDVDVEVLPSLSPSPTDFTTVSKPYPRSEKKQRAENSSPESNATHIVVDEPTLTSQEVKNKTTPDDLEPRSKIETCEASWPAVLNAGGSLDTHSHLEICTWIPEDAPGGAEEEENVCVCAHATVERLAETVRYDRGNGALPLAAHFVIKLGRAPPPPRSNLLKPSAGSSRHVEKILWSSAGIMQQGPISIPSDPSPGRDNAVPTTIFRDRLFCSLRSDGNLLLSRQLPKQHRREILWESSSGGELHNRYFLRLRYLEPETPNIAESVLEGEDPSVPSSSDGPSYVDSFMFEVVEIVHEHGTSSRERIIFSSREGDVSAAETIFPNEELEVETQSKHPSLLSTPLEDAVDNARRFLRNLFS